MIISFSHLHWLIFLQTIGQIESNNNDAAVGDAGKSIGRYQIQLVYWLDARVKGKYTDCRRRQYAGEVVFRYLNRYAKADLAKFLATGDKDAEQKLVRIHNGGPNGHRRHSTKKYYEKYIKAKRQILRKV